MATKQLLQDDLGFEPSKARAEAEMLTEAEGHVRGCRRPGDVEAIGVASALMGVQRAVVGYVRVSVLAGRRGSKGLMSGLASVGQYRRRLADGLGLNQLRALCAAGEMPFVSSLLERARRQDRAQLIEATTIFPSTTAAAITS